MKTTNTSHNHIFLSKKYKINNCLLFQLKSIYVAISDCSRDCIIKVTTDNDNDYGDGIDDDIDEDDAVCDEHNDDDIDKDDDKNYDELSPGFGMPGSSEYRERHSRTVPGIDHHIMIMKIMIVMIMVMAKMKMKMVICGMPKHI